VPARGGLGFLVDEERRKGKKLEARLTNGIPSSKTTRVDDSHAVVAPSQNDSSKVGATQENALEISSAEESSSSSDEESEEGDEEDEEMAIGQQGVGRSRVNGHTLDAAEDGHSEADAAAGAERMNITQESLGEAEGEDEESGEPSFGDLLRTRHPEQIDVRASFPDPMTDRQALIHTSGPGALTIPTGTSLVTVLTQALKTKDKDQLESCFQQTDIPTIRSTIQRLQSQHVATLLQSLAERIHKRPGRTGSLLVWVQWSLVAHGAYLATQPDVMAKLRALSQVLRERASGLQPLLHLKGKLDMLSAQLDMRQSMQAASRARADAEDEDDEEGVVYVEGQDDDDWSDEEDAVAGASRIASSTKGNIELSTASTRPQLQNPTPNTDPDALSDDSSDDDMPNGVAQEMNEESSDAEEDEEEGMFDVEAEETSDDEDDEAESSEEDDSEPESESEVSDDESDVSEGMKPLDPALLSRKR
jgi:U3 small nucleolar RNA-associated protein 5